MKRNRKMEHPAVVCYNMLRDEFNENSRVHGAEFAFWKLSKSTNDTASELMHSDDSDALKHLSKHIYYAISQLLICILMAEEEEQVIYDMQLLPRDHSGSGQADSGGSGDRTTN